MGKIERIKVSKSRTIRPGDSEEWVRSEYTIEASLSGNEEVEVAKAHLEGLIDGWLTSSKQPATTSTSPSIPNVDLHELEHDPEWRSWKKDDRGQCSFKAEEGHAGWIRTKNAGNAVLALYKAMKKQGLETVSLGLFEYKLSGEDFLQRKPLQKAEE